MDRGKLFIKKKTVLCGRDGSMGEVVVWSWKRS